jgi:hypothetical protein
VTVFRAYFPEAAASRLPPFRFPIPLAILAGTVSLRQNLLAKLVMPGLVPGIHVLDAPNQKDVDGRDKPGHDTCDPSL